MCRSSDAYRDAWHAALPELLVNPRDISLPERRCGSDPASPKNRKGGRLARCSALAGGPAPRAARPPTPQFDMLG